MPNTYSAIPRLPHLPTGHKTNINLLRTRLVAFGNIFSASTSCCGFLLLFSFWFCFGGGGREHDLHYKTKFKEQQQQQQLLSSTTNDAASTAGPLCCFFFFSAQLSSTQLDYHQPNWKHAFFSRCIFCVGCCLAGVQRTGSSSAGRD